MICRYCGTPISEEDKLCPYCGGTPHPAAEAEPVAATEEPTPPPAEPDLKPAPAKKKRKRPHPAVRALLGFVTFLVSTLLVVSLLLTALVLDVRLLTSGDTLHAAISSILTPTTPAPRHTAALGAGGVSGMLPEDVNLDEILSNVDLDLQNPDILMDEVYKELEKQLGEELTVTADQLKDFYQQSTLPEFIAEKVTSCAQDVINGTELTSITEEDIMALIDENAALIESVFDVELDETLRQQVLELVGELKLENMLQEMFVEQLTQITLGESGITVEELMATLRELTADTVLWTLIAVDVLLAALLFLTNWLRLGATLRSIGIPLLIVGAILSVPNFVVNMLADTPLYPTLYSLISPTATVHYGMLITGGILLIAGIVTAIITRAQQDT